MGWIVFAWIVVIVVLFLLSWVLYEIGFGINFKIGVKEYNIKIYLGKELGE